MKNPSLTSQQKSEFPQKHWTGFLPLRDLASKTASNGKNIKEKTSLEMIATNVYRQQCIVTYVKT